MGIYDMSDQEIIKLYQLALKGKKSVVAFEDEMRLLEAYNNCFELNEEFYLNYMALGLLDYIRKEMADRFLESVNSKL